MPLLIDDDLKIYNYANDNTLACTECSYDSIKEKLLHIM